MDFKEPERTKLCSCGRQVICITGFCALCGQEASTAFWAFIEDKISFTEFERFLSGGISFPAVMRRVRRK
jgi:hypothetical protein